MLMEDELASIGTVISPSHIRGFSAEPVYVSAVMKLRKEEQALWILQKQAM